MVTIRLDGEERRRGIVEAALPLFARKGFARTTTKEIAEAAQVSEALLFKHFASKVALYEEILRFGCRDVDPALERLRTLEASTETLVHMTHFMVLHIATGLLGDPVEQDTKHRLMVNSFLEDGEFARVVFENVFAWVYPKFAACLAAAAAAGDLAAGPVGPENGFWFGQHVAAMLAYVRLPGVAAAPCRGDVGEVATQAVWFILRGIGLSDAAIARHSEPQALAAAWPGLAPEPAAHGSSARGRTLASSGGPT
jgi:TetR/AcrR family transcriptional regulator, transcriptional repressor of aconitase